MFLSGFSFAINRDNSNFIDNTFWAQSPTSWDIIKALFGTGTSTGTAYTNHWENNNCIPVNMSVVYVATNDLNNTPNLAANTIYVLQWDQVLTQPINTNNNCIAIVSDSNSIIEHNTPLPALQNNFFRAISANNGLIIDGVESIGGNSTPAHQFLYTNLYNNITVNNIKAERFFGGAPAEGVLYFNVSENIWIFNSYIHNNYRRWIQSSTAQNIQIENNTIASNTFGIFTYDANNITIYNNKIYDNSASGIYGQSNTEISIEKNEIFNNNNGIEITSEIINTIAQNKIYNNTMFGISTASTEFVIITNNSINNNASNWINWSMDNDIIIDTNQLYNNGNKWIYLNNASGAKLHNLIINNTVNTSLDINWWTNNKYYGNIKIYGQTRNIPTLTAWAANDLAIANLWRTAWVITQVTTTAQLNTTQSYISCELGIFNDGLFWLFTTPCRDNGVLSPFVISTYEHIFGEKLLKKTNTPYYSGTVLYLNAGANTQLYITDENFGGRIQTTGGANYITGFIHYTNTNQLIVYSAIAGKTYNITGEDTTTLAPIFTGTLSGVITNNTNTITLPWTGTNGLKVIKGSLLSWSQTSNIYPLFRRYDTTGPDQIVLNTPTQWAQVVGNQVNLNWNAAVDTGAGVSWYNYIVASNSGFTNILFSGTTGALTTNITGIGFYPNYYRKVQAFDNLGNSGTATTWLFHYGFGYFTIVPTNTIFPANSGQTFNITAYDTNNNIITGYTNTVTFTLTGANTTPQTPPANYTFTLNDTGTHTFTGWLNINYPWVYTFVVSDTLSGGRSGTTTVTVTGQASAVFSGTISTNPSVATSWTTQLTITTTAPATYQVLVNNTPRVSSTPITNTTTIPLDLTTLPNDGSYTITVILNNNNGIYTYTMTSTIILDRINPVISIQSPATWSYQTLNQPMITWSVTETGAGMSGYIVVMSGTTQVYTATNQQNATYRAWTPLVDDIYTITVYWYDNAGNYWTAASTFTIDNTPPLILSGYPHQVVIANPFVFTWNAVDTGGIQSNSFMLRDFYGNAITPTWTTIFATNVTPLQLGLWSSLAPGIYKWKVQVKDNVPLTTDSQEFIFWVHNAIPWQIQWFMEIQSSFGNIISYGGNIYTNTTQLQATLFANIAVNVAINGNINPSIVWVPLIMPFPYTLQAINLTPGDGVKNISALFTTGSLNPYSVAKQITLDTTAPTLPTLNAPINGVAVTGAIVLSRSWANDIGAWLSWYILQVSTGTAFNTIIRSGVVSNPNETVTVASGILWTWIKYRRIITTDRVWNQSTSEVESFTIASPNTTVIMNGTGAVPNSFSIPAITNANPNILYRSAPVTVWGLVNGQRSSVSVSAGTLIKNGTGVGTTGTVINWDILEIDLIASSNYDTQVSSTLTVGTRSAAFNLRTKTEDQSYNGMSNTQRLQIRIIFDSLVNTYGVNDARTLTLMMTLRTAIESMLGLTNYSQAQKDALEYFLTLVNGYINDKWGANPFNGATYTARNGRVFSITFDTTRAAYTSPQFVKVAYFSSWNAMKLHIDIHNPGAGQGVLSGNLWNIENANRGNNIHVMPNGKIYRIEQWNDGKRYSPDTISQKKFNTQSELLARLRASNPSIRHY